MNMPLDAHQHFWQLARALIGDLPLDEQAHVWQGTARRLYGLGT
jgi:predicted TIM-barrel fold metal-dependent hydrolase